MEASEAGSCTITPAAVAEMKAGTLPQHAMVWLNVTPQYTAALLVRKKNWPLGRV